MPVIIIVLLKYIPKLNLDKRMKYTNEKYDITIIELKETDEIKNFLELDDIIIDDIINNNNKNKEFIDKTIYIIQYPESELSVSYGLLDNIYSDKNYISYYIHLILYFYHFYYLIYLYDNKIAE